MKITVMAGTPMDTTMGKTLLLQHYFIVSKSIAVSEIPKVQTYFQTMDKHK